MKARERDHYLRMIGNDLDSVKHHCRWMRRELHVIAAHLHVTVAPDALEEALNPSPEFINKVVQEARAEFVGAQGKMPRRKPKRSQRRRRTIPKRDFRRKHK